MSRLTEMEAALFEQLRLIIQNLYKANLDYCFYCEHEYHMKPDCLLMKAEALNDNTN